jgi:hypothetical protein
MTSICDKGMEIIDKENKVNVTEMAKNSNKQSTTSKMVNRNNNSIKEITIKEKINTMICEKEDTKQGVVWENDISEEKTEVSKTILEKKEKSRRVMEYEKRFKEIQKKRIVQRSYIVAKTIKIVLTKNRLKLFY